jgi:hypothetical protein
MPKNGYYKDAKITLTCFTTKHNMNEITIEFLLGPPGNGKSHFANTKFIEKRREIKKLKQIVFKNRII